MRIGSTTSLVLLTAGLALLLPAAGGARANTRDDDFARWLAELGDEAVERGISRRTVEATLSDVEPLPRVLELDRSQPKAPEDFCRYLRGRLTPRRIERGRRMLAENRRLLDGITADYGVPARYLVALWGLESNFGDYTGSWPVLGALATLAHDPRRSQLFREQMFAALRIIAVSCAPG